MKFRQPHLNPKLANKPALLYCLIPTIDRVVIWTRRSRRVLVVRNIADLRLGGHIRQLPRVFMYNLLDKTQENRYNDSSFKRLTKDDEENWDGEQVACH